MLISNPAFIFDLNGTMINDMHFHLKVWSMMLNERLGAKLSEDEVRSHMYGKNIELLERIFGKGKFTQAEADVIGKEKEDLYQEIYKPHLRLIEGLPEFLEQAHSRRIPLAIGSAAIPYNINFVLDNLRLHHYFKTIVSAEDVALSKPHPETFTKAAQLLGVKSANCIVFEDAPKGVEAAKNAGMKSIVITTMHSEEEFDAHNNILFFIKDYNDPRLNQLFQVTA